MYLKDLLLGIGGILLPIVLFVFLIYSAITHPNKSDFISIHGKTAEVSDNMNVQLKNGWFVEDYDIDYDNGAVILYIYKEY